MNLNLILSFFLWVLGIDDIWGISSEDNLINGDEIIDTQPYEELYD